MTDLTREELDRLAGLRADYYEPYSTGPSDLCILLASEYNIALRNTAPALIKMASRTEAAEAEIVQFKERAVREQKEIYDHLLSLVSAFVKEHFPENSGWQPLADTLGLIDQMDNASTIARDYQGARDAANRALTAAQARIAELERALATADEAINPSDLSVISLHKWNIRLKAATAVIRAARLLKPNEERQV